LFFPTLLGGFSRGVRVNEPEGVLSAYNDAHERLPLAGKMIGAGCGLLAVIAIFFFGNELVNRVAVVDVTSSEPSAVGREPSSTTRTTENQPAAAAPVKARPARFQPEKKEASSPEHAVITTRRSKDDQPTPLSTGARSGSRKPPAKNTPGINKDLPSSRNKPTAVTRPRIVKNPRP
jgi:hypothetical protein